MNLKKALLAATVLSLPVAAQAQVAPVSGLYIAGGVGTNYTEPFDTNLLGSVGSDKLSFNWGWAAAGSIGWGFGNGLRVEAEISYRNNRVNNFIVGNRFTNPAGGTLEQTTIMFNGFYDIPFGTNVAGIGISPYVGGGVGFGWARFDDVNGRLNATTRANITGTGEGFAIQAIGGVAFGLDQFVPGLALTTEYRFMYFQPSSVTAAANVNNAGFAAIASRSNYEPLMYNHSILVGLRYAFNAARPAPPPAPAAAPAPARTFLVFFDWDRADLTDRARQIIAEAANNARTVGSTRIEVQGHADRTGSAAYNQRLSVRRAEAVAAELVRRGIPRDQMSIQGFGFDRPLVPTAMGVREPQNRRVEIILR
jgi:outer membrane protein OmpA-like peptidoglycan-associated protein